MANPHEGDQPARRADVIVVASRITVAHLSYLQRTLECSGPILKHLIVVTGSQPDSAVERRLLSEPRVTLWPQTEHTHEVEACNRALSQHSGDVVLLSATANVSPGWLNELSATAHSD